MTEILDQTTEDRLASWIMRRKKSIRMATFWGTTGFILLILYIAQNNGYGLLANPPFLPLSTGFVGAEICFLLSLWMVWYCNDALRMVRRSQQLDALIDTLTVQSQNRNR